MRTLLPFASTLLLGLIGCSAAPAPQPTAVDLAQKYPEQWPVYSRNAGATRFSPLTHIDRENVKQLEVAWTFHTGETAYLEGSQLADDATFECTPLVLDGVMYLVTGSNRAFALDPATGKQLWSYDPQIDLRRHFAETAARGLAIWEPAKGDPHGQRKLFYGTLDGRLIGLDPETGKPLEGFGSSGEVSLHAFAMPLQPIPADQTRQALQEFRTGKSLPMKSPDDFPSVEAYNSWAFGTLAVPQVTSPPVVIGDLVVVGTSIVDNFNVQNGRGVVQAFNIHDGHRVWAWDPVPRNPEDPAYATWSQHDVGAANAWPPLSADPKRKMLFVPTTSASPDYYGGKRLGRNAHSDSLVALWAETGELAWSFQIVRHDLWDYDTPQQPILFDLDRDGEKIPAVAIGTKVGHLFVLDRRTGKSLFKNEERAVPQTDIPGEETWPTQLFPAELPTFGLREVRPEDAWGRNSQEREAARERIASLRWEGVFTPPSFEGSIHAPSNAGGMNWGGMAYDPERHLVITPATRIASVISLEPPEADHSKGKGTGERLAREVQRLLGTPYVMTRDYLWQRGDDTSEFSARYGFPELIPQTPPPWGTLSAVDLKTGKLAWEIPLGNMILSAPGETGYGETLGSFNFGGPIVTAGGLVFIAGTVDPYFRAYDVESGAKLWEFRLPAPGIASPMTYAINGRQYVVIAAGGHGKLKTTLSDALVAFRLPTP